MGFGYCLTSALSRHGSVQAIVVTSPRGSSRALDVARIGWNLHDFRLKLFSVEVEAAASTSSPQSCVLRSTWCATALGSTPIVLTSVSQRKRTTLNALWVQTPALSLGLAEVGTLRGGR